MQRDNYRFSELDRCGRRGRDSRRRSRSPSSSFSRSSSASRSSSYDRIRRRPRHHSSGSGSSSSSRSRSRGRGRRRGRGKLGDGLRRGLLETATDSESDSLPPIASIGAGLLDEGDDGSDGSVVFPDDILPTADWKCCICGNLNSRQRAECYRCSISYGGSQRALPSSELAVRCGALAAGGGGKAAELPAGTAALVLAELAVVFATYSEELVTLATAVRRRCVHVRFPTIDAATKALVLCRCALSLGPDGCRSPMEFSAVAVTPTSGASRGLLDGPGGILDDLPPAPSTAPPAAKPTAPAVDPALAGVPRDLWPSEWTAPEGFATEAEERVYLGRLSCHWKALSAGQRAYYDSGVKRALAAKQEEPAKAPAAAAEATEQQQQPPVSSPSSLSDIKKRLAERKAALAKGPSSTPASTPAAAAAVPVSESTSAISSLKERLAKKKAQLASGAAAPAATATPPPSTTAALTAAQPTLLYGFPVPPAMAAMTAAATRDGSVVLLAEMPWDTAERVVPPGLLRAASANLQQ